MQLPLYLHQHLSLQILSRSVWILQQKIATHREAKLVFMQGIVKRILGEAYREPTTPPSVGTSLAQSVFAGVTPPSRGPSPYFVTQPNYHNGQFHQYYPPENQSPISQFPATSAHTIPLPTTGMNTTQTSVTSTSTTSTSSTTPSTTVHCSSHATVSREAHRTHTVFTPIASPLITEIVLPSYQHFIQYLHQKGYTTEGGSIPTESGALNRYAETIHHDCFSKSEWLLFPTLSNKCDGRRGQSFSQHQFFLCRNRFLHQQAEAGLSQYR